MRYPLELSAHACQVDHTGAAPLRPGTSRPRHEPYDGEGTTSWIARNDYSVLAAPFGLPALVCSCLSTCPVCEREQVSTYLSTTLLPTCSPTSIIIASVARLTPVGHHPFGHWASRFGLSLFLRGCIQSPGTPAPPVAAFAASPPSPAPSSLAGQTVGRIRQQGIPWPS